MNKIKIGTDGRTLPIDQFEILRELGRGGNSVVYLVKTNISGERFAYKALKPEAGTIAEQLLHAEAQVLEELNGIPAFYGEVYEEDRFCGFLMEYVEGETLQKMLESGRVFTVREAAEAGVQLCGILARMHGMDPPRIYRDLKPGNILVREDGRYVLVDYGAVRAFREGAGCDTHPLGTEGYAAPEQYGGWEQSDERTDVYGVGAVLHHMVTGKPPLETGLRPLAEVMEALDGAPHKRSAEASRQYANLDKILSRCCSVSPAMRFRSCRELAKALERLRTNDSAERAWKKFVALVGLSASMLVSAGLFGATAVGAERSRYHALIAEAEKVQGSDEKFSLLQQAAGVRPQDPEAYLALFKQQTSDGVITQEEKGTLEAFLYENGAPEKMKKRKPSAYVKLEMEIGKGFLVFYEGGSEAARRCYANAAEVSGAGSPLRRVSEAMCEVLGEEWRAGRIEAWGLLVRESVREAMKSGDGAFAASVCTRAAGEIALFPDRFEAVGDSLTAMKEVVKEVEDYRQEVSDGWPSVPEKLAGELEAASETAARVIK